MPDIVSGAALRAMEWGRSDGDLPTIIKAAGGTIQICSRFYSLYFAESDRMGRAGPNLFESAPKYPRQTYVATKKHDNRL